MRKYLGLIFLALITILKVSAIFCDEARYFGCVQTGLRALVNDIKKKISVVIDHLHGNPEMKMLPMKAFTPSIIRTTKKPSFVGLPLIRPPKIKNVATTASVESKSDEKQDQVNVLNVTYVLTTPELIVEHGYLVETHTAVTEDGYILTIHRLLPPNKNVKALKKVAIMAHGLFGSSADWLLLGPSKALPYKLSNLAYDVWLVNWRGNVYSNTHILKSRFSEDYWNFSWFEMGVFDLPAVIDLVKKNAMENADLFYIGHSMGASAFLALMSEKPEYNNFFLTAFILAPLAYMNHTKGPLRMIAEDKMILNLEKEDYSQFWSFTDKFCASKDLICSNPLLFFTHSIQNVENPELVKTILAYVPAGGSKKTILHYSQLVRSGKFQRYDSGELENVIQYGQKTPPIIKLYNTKLPVALFSSADDWLATVPDMLTLLTHLDMTIFHHVVRRRGFSHTDFVWGVDADEVVYKPLIHLLNELNGKLEI